jgi:hypothetical protein
MMQFISSTANRVTNNTDPTVNDKIDLRTRLNIQKAYEGGLSSINRRLDKLDHEWDVERYLETGAASLSLLGATLGATVHRRWFALPAAVAGFLLQHSLQGWCPPLPVLRRMGVRTADEINQERYALKALRGDFANLDSSSDADSPAAALRVVRH